jgi:hypothetical protein
VFDYATSQGPDTHKQPASVAAALATMINHRVVALYVFGYYIQPRSTPTPRLQNSVYAVRCYTALASALSYFAIFLIISSQK